MRLGSEPARRRKSSYSGDCVETASGNGAILVRDTTSRERGALAFPASAWQAFTGSLKQAVRHGGRRVALAA